MNPVITVARLTVLEAARRRLVLALVVLTAIVIALTAWGFQHLATLTGPDQRPLPADEVRVGTSQVLILVEFMFSGVLALGAVLVAAPAISSDIESGVALAMFARPIARWQVLLGRWLGLAALIVTYTVCAGALELLVVGVVTGYSPPAPILVIAYLAAEGLVIMSLALLLSTRLPAMTAGIICLVLFFLAWIGGIAGTIGTVFNNDGIANAGTASQLLLPTDALWRGSVYNLEPALYRAVFSGTRERGGNPFFVQDPPTVAFLLWTSGWVAVILGVAVWSLNWREV